MCSASEFYKQSFDTAVKLLIVVLTGKMSFIDLIPALEEENDENISLYDYILNTPNRIYHYLDREPGVFNLDNLGDSYCFHHFRFYKDDIRKLMHALKIPDKISLKSRVKVTGEEALCVLLHRLSYPNRQFEFFIIGYFTYSVVCL